MTEKKIVQKPAKKKTAKVLRITLVRSPIGTTYRHRATLVALGLRHINQTVEQADTPQLKGMLAKVGHLVSVDAGTGKEK
ncbi:MAG: 50S ribosomal protein L30 [Anaerolineales bacterium]|jgi:large subunit ribosomal protein L30